MQKRPFTVLLAEDDADDAELLGVALEKSELPHALRHVADGETAISYLAGEAPYSDREQFPAPAVLLLDLKMPRKNGFEVLQWIRSSGAWTHLPVIILTSSDEPRDINRACELGATAYLTKSPSFKNVLEILSTISPS